MISIRIVISHSTSYRDQRFFSLLLLYHRLFFVFTVPEEAFAQPNLPNEFHRITVYAWWCAFTKPLPFAPQTTKKSRYPSAHPIQSNPNTSNILFIYLFTMMNVNSFITYFLLSLSLCVFFSASNYSISFGVHWMLGLNFVGIFSVCFVFVVWKSFSPLSQGWPTEMPSILISCSYQSSLCTHLNYSNRSAMAETLKCTHGKYNPMGK